MFNSVTGLGVRSPSLDVGSAGGVDPGDWPTDDPPVGPDGPLGPGTPQVVDVADKAPPQAPPPWMVPGPGGGSVPAGGGPYGPLPEQPPVPVAAPPGKPKPKNFPPIVSGLGKEVDKLLNLSPTMRELWAKALGNKYQILLRNGPTGTDQKNKMIFINPNSAVDGHKLTPAQIASLASHEIEHATAAPARIIQNPDREGFARQNTDRAIADEARAAFTNVQAWDEIKQASGVEIGISGGYDDQYIEIYERFKRGEISRDEAIAEMTPWVAMEPRYKTDGSVAETEDVFLESYRAKYDEGQQK